MQPSEHRGRGTVHILALVAMVTVFLGPVLFTGRIFHLGDTCCLFYPGYVYFRETVRQGVLPLWNPYMGCGEPFLADVERGVFYPPNLIYLFVPTTPAMVLSAAFHLLLAGVGAYGLSRAWRVSRMGSLLAGVLYAFNSYMITKIEFSPQLCTVVWFPMVLAAYVSWLRRRDRRSLFLMVCALCLQFLAGHPETVAFTVGALGLYALLVGVCEWRVRRAWTSLFIPVLGLGVAGALAVLLAMAQFYPTWEALQVSPRGDAADPMLDKASLHPMALFTLLVPSAYGVGGYRTLYWAPSCRTPATGAFYVGVVPMVVFLSVAIRRALIGAPEKALDDPVDVASRVRVPFLVILAVLFFCYAMGKYTPVFAFCQAAIPFLQRFIWPAKCLMCVVLSLSCLAGIGLDRLRLPPRCTDGMTGRTRFLLRWGAALVFVLVGLFVGACLMNGGEIGRGVLVRFFNLGSVYRARVPDIPWDVLRQDALKLFLVGFTTALLLGLYAFRVRARHAIAWVIVLTAFADLSVTNAYLLQPGPADVLEHRSRFIEKLRPPGKMTRYLSMEHILPDKCWESLALLVKNKRVEDLDMTSPGTDGSKSRTSLIRPVRELLSQSWPMADRAFNVFSVGNFVSKNVQRLGIIPAGPGIPIKVKERLLAMLNCDRILFAPDMRRAFAFGTLPTAHLAILDEPMPRAYVVGGVEVLPDEESVMRALLCQPFDPWEIAMVDRDGARGDSFADLTPQRVSHRIEHFEYGLNSLEMDVRSASSGLLVVSDAHFPGWHATVDGKGVPLLKVNGGFRGVRIAAGDSHVAMTYRPRSLQIGLAVSLVTLVVMLILLIPRARSGDTGGSDDTPRRESPSSCRVIR